VVAALVAPARADDGPNSWAKARKPNGGVSEAIGGDSAWCVGGAVAPPRRGPGFRAVKPARRRHFGHATLVAYLRDLGRAVAPLVTLSRPERERPP
jgi:murein endopeptidase